ncbi:MAG: MFS transporter [Pseudomonadota bacterium]
MSDIQLDRSILIGLFAMAVGVFVVANDFTALSVAIPAIEKTFGTDVTTAQWVINSYALVFGVVIVTGGRLADMFGRRRIFVLGSLIFAAFSLLGGLAEEVWLLVTCRALMGVGGALMWPAIIGLIFEVLPEEKAGLGGALVTAVAGLGNAAGPLIGGAFTNTLGWEWIFFINVPITLLGLAVVLAVVPKDRPVNPGERVDVLGSVILSLGLLALLMALDSGVDRGWTDPLILGLFLGSAVLLLVFLLVERRIGDAGLIPPDVMKNRPFLFSVLTTLLIAAVFFGAMVYLPQFMTSQLGFNAFEAGAGLIPMMLTYAIVSCFTGWVYARLGAKLTVAVGTGFMVCGMLLLSRIDSANLFKDLVPGMVVLGIGIGLFYSSIISAGVTSLDPSRASLASALIYMVNVTGGAVGLGMNTAIVAESTSQPEGISLAFTINALLALLGFVIALLFVTNKGQQASK